MTIFNSLDFTDADPVNIGLFIVLVVQLTYLRLAELAACIAYAAVFILPAKILFCIPFYPATSANLFHSEILPLRNSKAYERNV